MKFKKTLLITAVLGIALVGVHEAKAAWEEPTGCDPAVNPEACSVAAPLNTSIDDQTKEGALTVNDDLTVQSDSGTSPATFSVDGSGNLVISSSNEITSADVFNMTFGQFVLPVNTSDPAITAPGSLYWNSSSSEVLVYNGTGWETISDYPGDIFVNTTGDTMAGDLNMDNANINVNNGGDIAINNSGTLNMTDGTTVVGIPGTLTVGVDSTALPAISAYNPNHYGVFGRSSSNIGVYGFTNSSIGVYGRSANNYGVYGVSINGSKNGVYGNVLAAATGYGVKGCYNGTNCGYLGNSTYAGNFEGPVVVSNSTTTKSLSINHTGTTGNGVEIISGTSSSPAVYIESGDNMGLSIESDNGVAIHAVTNDTDNSGDNAIEGTAGDGVGVYGETSDGIAGVEGCYENGSDNCGFIGTEEYAGDFEGPVLSDEEVMGTKFLPTDKQYSVAPFIDGDNAFNTITPNFVEGGVTANQYNSIYDMVWDGNYMWLGAEDYAGNFAMLKMRSGDYDVIHRYQNSPYNNFIPSSIVDLGDAIGMLDDTNFSSSSCTYMALYKNDFSLSSRLSLAGDDCDDMLYDGAYVIVPQYNSSAGAEVLNIVSPDGTYYDSINVETLGCDEATNIAYDGENLWVTCQSHTAFGFPQAGDILQLQYSCTDSGTVLTCSVGDYTLHATDINPKLIFHDGQHLWVTYNYAFYTDTLRKFELDSGALVEKNTFDVGTGATDIEFDGTNIWVANYSASSLYKIPAYGPSTIEAAKSLESDLLAFDGTSIWNVITRKGSTYNFISLFATSNGSFGTQGQNHFRGLKITDDDGDLYCAYLDSGSTWAFVDSSSTDFAYYCE